MHIISVLTPTHAMSGSDSYIDYELGVVVGPNMNVSHVYTDMGVIVGSNGEISSYDRDAGHTYNHKTGELMAYDERFGATHNSKQGKSVTIIVDLYFEYS